MFPVTTLCLGTNQILKQTLENGRMFVMACYKLAVLCQNIREQLKIPLADTKGRKLKPLLWLKWAMVYSAMSKKIWLHTYYSYYSLLHMSRKSRVPGHLASHQFLVTLHMRKVGETRWQTQIRLTTVESYHSCPFGSTQKCLVLQCVKCVSACMNIGMISECGKTWGDSSKT